MSQTVSASTGAAYGVERVCLVWEQARSTFYDRRERAQSRSEGLMLGRRGPKPLVPDAELLGLIRRDLSASPFIVSVGDRGKPIPTKGRSLPRLPI